MASTLNRRGARAALGGLALLGLVCAARLLAVVRHGPRHTRYWRALAAQPAPPNALRLVALGDSTVQAIGAARPLDGLVGRAQAYLACTTGRPVHVVNVASGGATVADVVRDQLPRVDLDTADVVLVSVSSSDISRRTPLPHFAAALWQLVHALPPARTVISDAPLQPRRSDYQDVLARLADQRGIARADFAGVFRGEGRRLDVFAGDFHHLNGRGYGYWFGAFRPGLDTIVDRLCA